MAKVAKGLYHFYSTPSMKGKYVNGWLELKGDEYKEVGLPLLFWSDH